MVEQRTADRWRPGRFVAMVVITIAALTGAVRAGGTPAEAGGAPCLRPPVVGEVVDPFRAPACPWCAGNRGLEYRVGAATPVVNAAAGRVEFAGAVAGTTYVVVRLPGGWRVTYGRLTSLSVGAGDPVLAGRTIGRADGTFFLGLRLGDEYVDPQPYLGRLRGRPRLVPLDGTAERPAPVEIRCRVVAGPR